MQARRSVLWYLEQEIDQSEFVDDASTKGEAPKCRMGASEGAIGDLRHSEQQENQHHRHYTSANQFDAVKPSRNNVLSLWK